MIYSFHECHTIAAFHVLGRVLTRGKVHCRENVGCMSVKSANGSRHSASNQVLFYVEIHQVLYRAF